LASLGYEALATTSSGYAATLGRLDYSVTREEAIAGARTIAEAVDVPVSADLENCFENPAQTVRLATEAGLAGCSIEDFSGNRADPIYGIDQAAERVAAAANTASGQIVLTARAENYLHGREDLDDTIMRLRAYEDAGADVLYAPGITTAEDVRAIVDSVRRPLNVLARPGVPPVSELASLGVSRISVGGALAFAALGGDGAGSSRAAGARYLRLFRNVRDRPAGGARGVPPLRTRFYRHCWKKPSTIEETSNDKRSKALRPPLAGQSDRTCRSAHPRVPGSPR
jgi:2-methylisocitrate lyase-like PEP mutase family enzyme